MTDSTDKGKAAAVRAETPEQPAVVNPLPEQGDHDRIAMFSLKADGSPDQVAPEIIGDKQGAIDAAKVQFAQQAVSAADAAIRGAGNDVATTGDSGPSEGVSEAEAELIDTLATAEANAQDAAVAAVNAAHKG